MERIDEKTAVLLYMHPAAACIARGLDGRLWNPKADRGANCLDVLRYAMVTGKNARLLELMSEPHVMKTDRGAVDLNAVAEAGTICDLSPAVLYALDNRLDEEGRLCYMMDSGDNCILVYRTKKGNIRHRHAGVWPERIVYTKILGVIISGAYGAVLHETQDGMEDALGSATIKARLVEYRPK